MLVVIINISSIIRMRSKSAMPQKITNLEAELQQQQQKSKILDEDRKNFHQQAEQIKEKNKQQIRKLKDQNQHLRNVRDQYIANRKQRRPFTAQDQSMTSTNQIGPCIKDQNYLRRILDKQRHLTKTKKAALFSLQDKLKQVQQNKLGFIEENPLMRNIRVLENRLDKVMIKYNEAQSIQKTYEQVVKRLREQRVGYDNQLSIIQSSLKGKQKDFQQLLLLAHDAAHAKEAAYGELKRFQQRRITVQDMRGKYISQKKNELNKQTPNMVEQVRNIERRDNASPKLMEGFGSSYQYDDQYQKQQLGDYEDAFRKLKEVTGVVDANQIIQKFKTQGLTTSSLEQLRESYKNKIQKLKIQKQELKRQLQNNKLVLDRGKDDRRRVDEIESQTAQISNQLQRASLKAKKLSTSLINIKAGIQHLKDLTKFYKRQSDEQGHSGTQQDLKSLNEKLRRMYDIVKNDPQYMKRSYKASAHMIQDMLDARQDSTSKYDDEEN